MSDNKKNDKSHNILSHAAKHDAEQPGDTPTAVKEDDGGKKEESKGTPGKPD